VTGSTFTVPGPPEDLSYEAALENPMLVPLKTRIAAAHQMMEAGAIDGWQALAFVIYGVATIIEDDDELPIESVDQNGDWIIGDDFDL